MRHENRRKNLFYTFLVVISFAHPACSQSVNTVATVAKPVLIDRLSAYKKSVERDSLKRMVALKDYVNPLFTDFKYATFDNFTHTVLYHSPIAFGRLEAVLALQRVQKDLSDKGMSLKFYDAYRPYEITKKMWKVVPDERYAANPAKGSGHNRGAAFDVSLADLKTGKELEMPTAFDNFTEKAHHNYMSLSAAAIQNRKLLKETMERHGFVALETEWWHYSLPNAAAKFELLDLSFSQLASLEQ